MQKAIIVSGTLSPIHLNNELKNGWVFVSACPMPSSIYYGTDNTYKGDRIFEPQCLVILRRDNDHPSD